MSPITWKRRPILLDMTLIYLCLLFILVRWRHSCAFTMLGEINAFIVPGCRVRLPVDRSINSQFYPTYLMMGAGLLCEVVGVFMVATWFSMGPCLCIRSCIVLYLCIFVTVVLPFEFLCAKEVMGYVSSGITCGLQWCGIIIARHVCSDTPPGVSTLGSVIGSFYYGSTVFLVVLLVVGQPC